MSEYTHIKRWCIKGQRKIKQKKERKENYIKGNIINK
jgi:hypothetical protein